MPFGLDLQSLGDSLLYLTAFFGAFLAALWLSLVFWAYRDIKARSHDRFVHFFAALVVAVLGPPGLIVYLILRPQKTLDEAYQHTLEEEALLTEIEERRVCPACGSLTETGWQICPTCHTRLKKPCTNCGELLELRWQLCPHCGTPTPGVKAEGQTSEVSAYLG